MPKPVPVQVIAILSGKGGSGKTQTAINLACALTARGRRVLLWDGNFSMPGVSVALDLELESTVSEVLAQRCSLNMALYNSHCGFQVLAGASLGQSSNVPTRQQIYGLIQAMSTLEPMPDVLVIDCAPGLNDDVMLLAQAATERLVIVEDEPAGAASVLYVLHSLQSRYGVSRFRLLVNKVQTEAEGMGLHERLLQKEGFPEGVVLDFSGEIPFDDMLQRAVQRQMTLCEAFPRSRAAQAFKALAEQVDGWPLAAHPRGSVEFFTERLIEVQSFGYRAAPVTPARS